MIQNISFIVIARNESFAIEKCLASIASMPLTKCEVICVDSYSTDNTLDVMKGYIGRIENYKIIQCSGYLNAAVGRNAGLKYATKKYVFFVDGDIELYPDFIAEALDIMESGKADAVTGGLDEIIYSNGYKQIRKGGGDPRYYPRVMEISACGGCFLIRRQIAETVGPWNELMDVKEDFDYALRLCCHGRFLALPISMCTHHTLAYNERPWLNFKKRYPMYFGMLIRKNWDQPKALLLLFRRNRGFIAGFVVYGLFLVGILATGFLSLPFLYVAFAVSFMVISDLFWGAIRKKNVLNHFLTHYLYVPLIVAGIFLDMNRDHASTTVERII